RVSGAAVESAVERHQPVPVLAARARPQPRELDRRLDAFGAAVGEEHSVVSGGVREREREIDRRTVAEQIRYVAELTHLPRDVAREPVMAMTERVDADSAREVEVRGAPIRWRAHRLAQAREARRAASLQTSAGSAATSVVPLPTPSSSAASV